MTHSIDFKEIEEKLFLIQQIKLGSRVYCEERGIGRKIKPYGEGAWSDYSYQLQSFISRYSIECAVKTRMVQDFVSERSSSIDFGVIDKESCEGSSIGAVHSGIVNLTIRESCNKIIHATKVELAWAEDKKKRFEYWSGGYHLRGFQSKKAWHIELDMQNWAIALENFHQIIDEQVDWEMLYGL